MEFLVVFFFQAEDGIRDRNVTGVQTCALPICETSRPPTNTASVGIERIPNRSPSSVRTSVLTFTMMKRRSARLALLSARSEERRVGKEHLYWWVVEFFKNKKHMRYSFDTSVMS